MHSLLSLFVKTDNGLVGTDCTMEDFAKLEVLAKRFQETPFGGNFHLVEETLKLLSKVIGGNGNGQFINWLKVNYDNGNSKAATAISYISKYLNGEIASTTMVTMLGVPFADKDQSERVNINLEIKEDNTHHYEIATFVAGAGLYNAINFFLKFNWNEPKA